MGRKASINLLNVQIVAAKVITVEVFTIIVKYLKKEDFISKLKAVIVELNILEFVVQEYAKEKINILSKLEI